MISIETWIQSKEINKMEADASILFIEDGYSTTAQPALRTLRKARPNSSKAKVRLFVVFSTGRKVA